MSSSLEAESLRNHILVVCFSADITRNGIQKHVKNTLLHVVHNLVHTASTILLSIQNNYRQASPNLAARTRLHRAWVSPFFSSVYQRLLPVILTSSPELMQRNPRSTRQAWIARTTASNLSLSLYKRRRFCSFTSAILLSWRFFPRFPRACLVTAPHAAAGPE